MYDVSTQTVSKLSGELSSAFVEAAENNADDVLPVTTETRVPSTNQDASSDGENDEIPEQFIDIQKIKKRSDVSVGTYGSSVDEEKKRS